MAASKHNLVSTLSAWAAARGFGLLLGPPWRFQERSPTFHLLMCSYKSSSSTRTRPGRSGVTPGTRTLGRCPLAIRFNTPLRDIRRIGAVSLAVSNPKIHIGKATRSLRSGRTVHENRVIQNTFGWEAFGNPSSSNTMASYFCKPSLINNHVPVLPDTAMSGWPSPLRSATRICIPVPTPPPAGLIVCRTNF